MVVFKTDYTVKVNYKTMIVLQTHKRSLFTTGRDIFFVGLYVQTCESAVYGVTPNGYGIKHLEQYVMDFYDSFDIIACGDLNAWNYGHSERPLVY